jgi:hypothetical protein
LKVLDHILQDYFIVSSPNGGSGQNSKLKQKGEEKQAKGKGKGNGTRKQIKDDNTMPKVISSQSQMLPIRRNGNTNLHYGGRVHLGIRDELHAVTFNIGRGSAENKNVLAEMGSTRARKRLQRGNQCRLQRKLMGKLDRKQAAMSKLSMAWIKGASRDDFDIC